MAETKSSTSTRKSRVAVARPDAPFSKGVVGVPMADVYTRPASRTDEKNAIIGKANEMSRFLSTVSDTFHSELKAYKEVKDEKETYDLLDQFTKLKKEKGSEAFTEEENKWWDKKFSGRSFKLQQLIADRLAVDESSIISSRINERVRQEQIFSLTGEAYQQRLAQIASEETQKRMQEMPVLASLSGFSDNLSRYTNGLIRAKVNNHDARLDAVVEEKAQNEAAELLRQSFTVPFEGPTPIPVRVPTTKDEKTGIEDVENIGNAPYFSFGNNTGDVEHFKQLHPASRTALYALGQKFYRLTGDKLQVNSTFRTKEENVRVKGAEKSRHLRGLAFDIDPAQVKQLKARGILDELGLEAPFKEHPEHVQFKADYTIGGEAHIRAAKVAERVPTGNTAAVLNFQTTLDNLHNLYPTWPVSTLAVNVLKTIENPELLVELGNQITVGTGARLSNTAAWIDANMPEHVLQLQRLQHERTVQEHRDREATIDMELTDFSRSLHGVPMSDLHSMLTNEGVNAAIKEYGLTVPPSELQAVVSSVMSSRQRMNSNLSLAERNDLKASFIRKARNADGSYTGWVQRISTDLQKYDPQLRGEIEQFVTDNIQATTNLVRDPLSIAIGNALSSRNITDNTFITGVPTQRGMQIFKFVSAINKGLMPVGLSEQGSRDLRDLLWYTPAEGKGRFLSSEEMDSSIQEKVAEIFLNEDAQKQELGTPTQPGEEKRTTTITTPGGRVIKKTRTE